MGRVNLAHCTNYHKVQNPRSPGQRGFGVNPVNVCMCIQCMYVHTRQAHTRAWGWAKVGLQRWVRETSLLLYYYYCIIFHTNNCKLTLAYIHIHTHMHRDTHIPPVWHDFLFFSPKERRWARAVVLKSDEHHLWRSSNLVMPILIESEFLGVQEILVSRWGVDTGTFTSSCQ